MLKSNNMKDTAPCQQYHATPDIVRPLSYTRSNIYNEKFNSKTEGRASLITKELNQLNEMRLHFISLAYPPLRAKQTIVKVFLSFLIQRP